MYFSRKILSLLMVMTLLLTALLMGAAAPEHQMIVVFKDNTTHTQKDQVGKALGLTWISDLVLVNGRSVRIPAARLEALKNNPNILAVHEDAVVQILGKPVKPPATQPAEVTPWGILAINANLVTIKGEGIKVGILDTGIDSGHPDLDVYGGMNFISPYKSYMDDNGHGTHVAGTVAALDNEIGVIGVGPQIELYALKALNSRGSGYLSDIIEALQWAVNNQLDVVNMSLGTDSDSPVFREAIGKAADAGLIMVAAAGNDGRDVDYPAAYEKVMAVAAVDIDSEIAYFSSPGPQVDISAPGVAVLSTVRGGKYATYSGTSMAAPHVTGTVALIMDASGSDGWPKMTYESVLNRITGTAGQLGDENDYGAGLIDASEAVK